jgi:hypothetical protein
MATWADHHLRIGAGGGITAAVVTLLLVAPSTVATGTHAIVLTPPFKAKTVYSSDYIISSGNGSMNYTKPFFNRQTGFAGYWGDAVIPRCNGTCNSVQADYSPSFAGPQLGVELPINVPANYTSVELNSTLTFVETLHAHPGTCHFQNVTGRTSVCGWYDLWLVQVSSPYLDDVTANRSYGPSNTTLTTSSWKGVQGYIDGCQIVNGANTCFSYRSGPISNLTAVRTSWNTTFKIPATTTPHRYLLELSFLWVVYAGVSTSVAGPQTAKATLSGFSNSVELNMARTGHGFYLNSITYS